MFNTVEKANSAMERGLYKEEGLFWPWLRTIATNEAIKQSKKCKRECLQTDSCENTSLQSTHRQRPDVTFFRREQSFLDKEHIRNAVDTLDDGEYVMIKMRYFKGKSVSEIADEFDMNPAKVSRVLYRIRRRLEALLQEYWIERND